MSMMIRRTAAAAATRTPQQLRWFTSCTRTGGAADSTTGTTDGASMSMTPFYHHHHQRCSCCCDRNYSSRRQMSSNSSSSKASSSVEPDWVRTAIQKMILEQQQPTEHVHESSTRTVSTERMSIPITAMMNSGSGSESGVTIGVTTTPISFRENPDLEKTLQSLQNQLQESELCIQDCYDCMNTATTTHEILQKEIDAADHSIDMAVAHFVDLLDAKNQLPPPTFVSTSPSDASAATTTNHASSVVNKNIPTEDLVKQIKHLRAEIAKLKLVQQQSILTTTL